MRTSDCFALEGIDISGYSPPPDHSSVRSAAMGTQDWLPVTRWKSALEAIEHYRNQDYSIVALETSEQATPIEEFHFSPRGIFLLGNEELGLSEELLSHAHYQISIPMFGRKASLNVANCFAIATFQLRQFLKR